MEGQNDIFYLYDFIFIFRFFDNRSAKTGERILTRSTSKDVVRAKEVPFGGENDKN